jgi:hypothetical protein
VEDLDVTFLSPEDAAMYQAAGLAQLPRMPNAQAMVLTRLAEAPERPDPAPVAGDATSVTPCACGCGEPVARAATGRPGVYASGACRMRAMRARRRSAR